MRPASLPPSSVMVVMHDVSPATWPACEIILKKLSRCGDFPVSHLVVPHYHGAAKLANDATFRRALDAKLNQGDELVLHGYYHLDQADPICNPMQRLMRSIYTAGEGEFAALKKTAAATLIEKGCSEMAALGWEVHGFVPPAWLASAGSREALEQSGLRYTSTRKTLIDLQQQRETPSPSLVWSTRAWWRRRASAIWNEWLRRQLTQRNEPLIRLGIHPADARYPEAIDFWFHSLQQALECRRPVTKIEWITACGA